MYSSVFLCYQYEAKAGGQLANFSAKAETEYANQALSRDNQFKTILVGFVFFCWFDLGKQCTALGLDTFLQSLFSLRGLKKGFRF